MNLPHFAGTEGENTGRQRIVIVLMSKVFGLTIQRASDN